ncbi:LysR family transcriptional regulator [Nonomuraea sp. NPDC046570]|uniref:LysR family transcriptional regulator n=1 Tax=Nonomuraea sp. NPDC046570 TaxID=3155255 RepID=UPI0033D17C7A
MVDEWGLAPNLALLVAIRETEHVTRAAELLGIPQPTASRRLAALSAAVGAPLTVPAGRGVRLTRAGRTLADAAARALAVVEAGAREVREEADPATGRVVLGFLHLLGRSLVPALVRGFREHHPGVRLSLVQGSRQEMLRRLRHGEIDLVMVAPLPSDDPEFSGVPLADQELVLTVPGTHRLAHRRRVRVAELADEPFVTLEQGYGLRQITDELCAAAGFQPRIAFEGQESDTVRGLVGAGLGVALLPRFEPAPPPGVAEIRLEPALFRTIGLVRPATGRLTPAVRAFHDHVLSAIPTWPANSAPQTLPAEPERLGGFTPWWT